MASALAALLPAPKHAKNYTEAEINQFASEGVVALSHGTAGPKSFSENPDAVEPPKYGERQGFVPRDTADYGDGGAFPEIHVLQYPLNMGRKDKTGTQVGAKTTALKVDSEGNVKYDMIVRQHMRKGFHVATSYLDLMEKDATEDELAKPDVEAQAKLAEKTRLALGQLVDAKIAAAQPHLVKKKDKEPTYIRYTPSQQSTEHNSGARQRIIRLQDMPTDPLEPPQFQHKKLPQGPPSPPVPIMHSPPRKITVQDQQNWKIPPCISNWKNRQGYTIPLDKRLAADGRGLQEVQVNDKFAKLSESLFVSERNARKEIEARANAMKKIMRKQKEVHEDALRNRAAQARRAGTAKGKLDEREAEDYETAAAAAAPETEESIEARQQREELRKERARERTRELRMENMKDERRAKTVAARDQERDVSEQIALGKAVATSKDGMFDQRLFNQDTGMASNLGGDDDYAVYDKALFKGQTQNYIYRQKQGEEMSESEMAKLIQASTNKFKPDTGFKGAEKSSSATTARDKPVEFERDESDPFGLNQLLSDGKGKGSLDNIGKRGTMSAEGSNSSDSYSREGRGHRGIEFDDKDRESSKRRRKD